MKKKKGLFAGLLVALVVTFSVVTIAGHSTTANASDERGSVPDVIVSTTY